MPRNILSHHKLGSISIVELVLGRLRHGPAIIDDIREHAALREQGAHEAMLGCLGLLLDLEYIKEEEGLYSSQVQAFHSDRFLADFVNMLGEEDILREVFNHRTVLREGSKIYIDNKSIPIRFARIRNFFSRSKIIVKEEGRAYRYYVSDEYLGLFAQHVLPLVEEEFRAGRTLEDLKAAQAKQEERGEQAEEFVLRYERRMRRGHPSHSKIQIISHKDTGAGYDIKSYLSDASTILDKFIEVKSYLGTRRFYWSRNEREIARQLGSNYYLYIVDSERLASEPEDYEPEIIENPYEQLEGRGKTCETWSYDLDAKGKPEAK